MPLSLAETQAVTTLAECLYPFLPGKPHPFADQTLSFPGVAAKLGLQRYWTQGSKGPAIARLLTETLDHERGRFCPLLLAIVQHGMAYRMSKDPVTRDEINRINRIVLRLRFKIPELHDNRFLEKLPQEESITRQRSQERVVELPSRKAVLHLRKKLLGLESVSPVKRGFDFEKFLNDMFAVYSLSPRKPFRIRGEQLDGSFQMNGDTYLLEARWRNAQANISDLLAFSGKVTGKAQWTRGLFVSYSGFSPDGLEGFAKGRATNIVGMDGLDLYYILKGGVGLRDVLERKVRYAAETSCSFISVRDLFPDVDVDLGHISNAQ